MKESESTKVFTTEKGVETSIAKLALTNWLYHSKCSIFVIQGWVTEVHTLEHDPIFVLKNIK